MSSPVKTNHTLIKSVTRIDRNVAASGQPDEIRAFRSIICCSEKLGLNALYRCKGYFADGYFEDKDEKLNAFEIKSKLDFNSFCRAYCQLAGLRNTLPNEPKKEFAADHIFFNHIDKGWSQKKAESAKEHISRLTLAFGISRPLRFWQVIEDHPLIEFHEVLPQSPEKHK